MITLKLHAGCLFIPMLRQLACSDCYILGFFYTNKLNIKIMTLKEKFIEVEFNLNDLESITEEFAIGFVEWKDKISDSDLRYSKKYAKSNDELLKIYKIEKGL